MAYEMMYNPLSFLAGLSFTVFILITLVLGVGLYLYSSLAYRAIAIKARYPSPNLAWIPGIGGLIICNRVAKMPKWPWFLLIGVIIPFIGYLALLVFAVYSLIWVWKTYQAMGRPGWWVLLGLIPFVGGLIALVLLGVVAWGNPKN